jgi:hypothetical protein
MSISTYTNAIRMNHVYDDEVRGEGRGAGEKQKFEFGGIN